MPHITTALLISSDKLLHFHQNDSFTISTSLDCEQVGDSQIQNYVSGQPSQFCHFLAVFCPILQQIPSRGCSQPCQTPVEVSKRLAAKVVQSKNASKQNTTVRLMACAITQKQQKKNRRCTVLKLQSEKCLGYGGQMKYKTKRCRTTEKLAKLRKRNADACFYYRVIRKSSKFTEKARSITVDRMRTAHYAQQL